MLNAEWVYVAALGMFENKDESVSKDMLNPEFVEITVNRGQSLVWKMWFRVLRRLRGKEKRNVYEHDVAY